MKKLTAISLFLISFFYQINVYAEVSCHRGELNQVKMFEDKIKKINESGELLPGARFYLHDINNKINISYTESSSGEHFLSMYDSWCYEDPISNDSGKHPVIKKLSQSLAADEAGETIKVLILDQVKNIHSMDEWNEEVPGYYLTPYTETTDNVNREVTRKTPILYPLFLDENRTPDGYVPSKRYVVLVSGVFKTVYYISNGDIYSVDFDFDKIYYAAQTYYKYDKEYDYSKMYSLDHDDWTAFYNQYAEDNYEEECHEEEVCPEVYYGSFDYSNIGDVNLTPLSCHMETVCIKTHNIVNVKGDVILELSNSINDNESISATKGETVRYQTTVRNKGSASAKNVQVKTVVPEELEYIQNSANFGGEYDEETRTVTWDISKLDAGSEAELKYRATVSSDINDLGTIQLRSTVTSDEYPEEIDSGEVTIEVQKKSEAFVDNATEVIKNPKTGSILSMILCTLAIMIIFVLNYRYQKKKTKF